MDNGSVTAYRDASRFLVEAVRAVPDSGWDAPGLGDWNVRELVGHANRGHTTVADYLVRPQQPEPPGSTYFSDAAIAARGREAVRALGADPASAVAAASTAVVELIEQSPPDAKIGSPAGTMTLAQFLPSRTAELTIHALDIVRAIGADLSAPPTALRESLAYAAQRAAGKSGQDVLLALSGRAPLPAGYSVY